MHNSTPHKGAASLPRSDGQESWGSGGRKSDSNVRTTPKKVPPSNNVNDTDAHSSTEGGAEHTRNAHPASTVQYHR